jgi:hypothetical protein
MLPRKISLHNQYRKGSMGGKSPLGSEYLRAAATNSESRRAAKRKFGLRICFLGISQNIALYARRFSRRLVTHHNLLPKGRDRLDLCSCPSHHGYLGSP